MENRKFGYIRVSSRDQNEGRQLQSMEEVGISPRDIFMDKQSGKNFNREQYQLLKRMIRKGDILYIHSLDRFGRNKEEILQEWNAITKEIEADIVVLDMPLLDTTQYKDSLGTFIADLVLQILSWMAQEERDRIRKRQREGINAALKSGISFGRPKAQVSQDFIEAYNRWKRNEITAVQAMKEANVKKTTFYKLVKQHEDAMNM
ncbi:MULTISPECIES: recombinase family protein [Priestia]|uniref:Recombinase family protein n=5 Tax=Priestia TaxID=2800373 RepID=A0AAX6BT31_PRIMG|nr:MULTISPECIES: recombinase family protein [Priestia]MBK0295966.1 recombinase family protein [Bacillus sp. S34]UPK52918.1 recombinase family protein [Bacillus sp. H8-1]AEN92065.1 Resolvase domain protein [Priestia megaterium WSH-002]AKP80335.1 Putative transposon Tn552 DNA-invertase bin3 [Priestia megaterium Q3]AWD68784.1 recombinase family protein [Priestia megaterium]